MQLLFMVVFTLVLLKIYPISHNASDNNAITLSSCKFPRYFLGMADSKGINQALIKKEFCQFEKVTVGCLILSVAHP